MGHFTEKPYPNKSLELCTEITIRNGFHEESFMIPYHEYKVLMHKLRQMNKNNEPSGNDGLMSFKFTTK